MLSVQANPFLYKNGISLQCGWVHYTDAAAGHQMTAGGL